MGSLVSFPIKLPIKPNIINCFLSIMSFFDITEKIRYSENLQNSPCGLWFYLNIFASVLLSVRFDAPIETKGYTPILPNKFTIFFCSSSLYQRISSCQIYIYIFLIRRKCPNFNLRRHFVKQSGSLIPL